MIHDLTVHKKWISNGTYANYFTVGCRTDRGGIIVLVIPRGDGIETKLITTSYSSAAGTAYVTFDHVFVPSENILGPENGGLQVILSNFNHERSIQPVLKTENWFKICF